MGREVALGQRGVGYQKLEGEYLFETRRMARTLSSEVGKTE